MNSIGNNRKSPVLGSRELIAFAFVERAYAETGDIVAGLLPLFAPVLAKYTNERFDAERFANDVQATFDLPMRPIVAGGLIEKLAAAKLLYLDPAEPHTYRVAQVSAAPMSIDEAGVDALLVEFGTFAKMQLSKFGLDVRDEELPAAFFRRLSTAQMLRILDRQDRDYFRGKTLKLKAIGENDNGEANVDEALDIICADFVLGKIEDSGTAANLIATIVAGALIAEVVLTLQTPSSISELSKLSVVVDGPILLDLLDLSSKELHDYASDLFELIDKAGVKKVVFDHIVEEMRGTIRAPLDAMQRGEAPFGPLGNRIRSEPAHLAYARASLDNLEKRLNELGLEIISADAYSSDAHMRYCSSEAEEALRNSLGPLHLNLERRIRDAQSIATILRMRRDRQKFQAIVDTGYVFVTRNEQVVSRSEKVLTQRNCIGPDQAPPALSDRRFAGYLWFAVGGSVGALTLKKLIANCTYVLTPRLDVISKVRQFLTELDPVKADVFMSLMRDQRAQRCLMSSTLGFPSAITPDNAEQILEEVRQSTAEEVRAKAAQRQSEIERAHKEQIESISALQASQVKERDGRILNLEGRLVELQDSGKAKESRFVGEIADLKSELTKLQQEREASIADGVQSAAQRASGAVRWLGHAYIATYVAMLAGGSFYFSSGNPLVSALVTAAIGGLGYWIVPQSIFGYPARWLWKRQFTKRVDDLGIASQLADFDIDYASMSAKRRAKN